MARRHQRPLKMAVLVVSRIRDVDRIKRFAAITASIYDWIRRIAEPVTTSVLRAKFAPAEFVDLFAAEERRNAMGCALIRQMIRRIAAVVAINVHRIKYARAGHAGSCVTAERRNAGRCV